jgi:hypothetical protein
MEITTAAVSAEAEEPAAGGLHLEDDTDTQMTQS